MKILVIQLARLGDILQTLPALQGLKKKYPNCEISLMVRSKFADAAKLSAHVNRLIEFPTQEILGPIFNEIESADASRETSLLSLASWLSGNFKGEKYDLLLNMTFSNSSAWIASFINASEKKGLHRAADAGYLLSDSWSQYFFSQVLQKNLNTYHLNDLFASIAGAQEEIWPLQPKPDSGISIAKNPSRIRFGVQLTASQAEKSPSLQTWAMICQTLAKNCPAEFIFFGSDADVARIEDVIRLAHISEISENISGLYPFNENLSLVRTCDYVITPDTAMVHLASIASALNGKQSPLKIINIPMGNVRPDETGPYGDGHYVLYPADSSADVYAQAILEIVQTGKPQQRVPCSMTMLAKDSSGAQKSFLSPLNFDQEENTNFFQKAYYLLAQFRCAGQLEDIEIPKIGSPSQSGALDRFLSVHENLLKLKKTADFGSHYCVQMVECMQDETQLKDLSNKLSQVDTLLESLAQAERYIKPLIDSWKVAKGNILSDKLADLIGLTEGTYRVLSQNVEIVIQLMETAVKAAHESVKNRANLNTLKESDV